ncbi:MAG TPA: cupredoxin domain-containing protein [Gemmatimonadales bacterium]|nr:cupredoxin domain-containing protein [Gemmatimonadales bacterium]
MTASQWVVTLGGAGAIAWVIYYFFLAARAGATARLGAAGIQRVAIEVLGGYAPSTVTVRRGLPVELEFHRADSDSCTEEVVLEDFGIRQYLPAYQTTAIQFTPTESGTFAFSCGMGMVHGRLVVQDEVSNDGHN